VEGDVVPRPVVGFVGIVVPEGEEWLEEEGLEGWEGEEYLLEAWRARYDPKDSDMRDIGKCLKI